MATGFHCSPVANLVPEIGGGRTLCVGDDRGIAASYLRGGLDTTHYLYTFEYPGRGLSIATEADIITAWEAAKGRKHNEMTTAIWDAVKVPAVRAALIAAGFEAVRYGDSHEGCDYETTEFLAPVESLRITGVEEVRYTD